MDNLHIRVLSIDPGSSNMGYTFSMVSYEHKTFTVIESGTINIEKVCGLKTMFETPKLQLISAHLGSVITQLLENYQPDVVICEAPYMGRFPHAYAVLVMCTQVIQYTVGAYDFTILFTMVEPSTVKKRVGVRGTSGDKDAIKSALLTIKTITLPANYNDLDEHAIDSIAIGYSEFYNILS